jgi:hypothetical protein
MSKSLELVAFIPSLGAPRVAMFVLSCTMQEGTKNGVGKYSWPSGAVYEGTPVNGLSLAAAPVAHHYTCPCQAAAFMLQELKLPAWEAMGQLQWNLRSERALLHSLHIIHML